MLANAAGEDHRRRIVQRRQPRNRLHQSSAEDPNCQLRPRVSRSGPPAQLTHVVHSAQRLQPRVAIDHSLHRIRRRACLPHQEQNHAGIEVAGARPHHYAAGRSQPHRRIHRLAVDARRHAASAAQVRDQHGPRKLHADRLPQLRHHRLARKPMKSVPPHTLLAHRVGQRIHSRLLRHRLVEDGVEARNVRHATEAPHHLLDDLQGLRVVQRSKLARLAQLRQHIRRQPLMSPQMRPRMHHAIAHRVRRRQPIQPHRALHHAKGLLHRANLHLAQPAAQVVPRRVAKRQLLQPAANAAQLALIQRATLRRARASRNRALTHLMRAFSQFMHRELDRRRPGIQHQNMHSLSLFAATTKLPLPASERSRPASSARPYGQYFHKESLHKSTF